MSSLYSVSRRRFLRSSALSAMGLLAVRPRLAGAAAAQKLEVLDPIHGAVLHRRLGREVPGGLEIKVNGVAPPGAQVVVQGRPAVRDGDKFCGTAVLQGRETEVPVVAEGGGQRQESRVRLVWDQHSQKRYRFVIDDNSFFLRDITQKRYPSLFDCFYLKMLRDLHTKYGACFTLNIYYTTGEDWNLKRFPDKYRSEWKD